MNAEREAAKTQHTTIQDMGADIRTRLIPAVEKLVEISGGILDAGIAVAKAFGYETPSERAAREEQARLNVQRAMIQSIGGLDTDAQRSVMLPGAGNAVDVEIKRLRDSEIEFMDIVKAGLLGDATGIGSALGARLTPTSPTGELPWYARPANEVAGEIGQQIGAVVADTLGPLASFAERLNPVSINNVYNVTGGARELEDTRRVSDQANMRVVRELQP